MANADDPMWLWKLGYHRDHLKYVVGERAGHWNDVRATYGTPVTTDITSPSVSGSAPSSDCLQENSWHGRAFGRGLGRPPAKVRANSPT